MSDRNAAFYYIEPDPLNGAWIDLEDKDGFQEILEELAEATGKTVEELEALEIGVADAEGLARNFTGKYGSFALDEFIACRDHEADEDAKAAYISLFGSWDSDQFDEAYCGDFSRERDPRETYAYQLIDDCYNLDKLMGNLAGYFDYEKFARDLFATDYSEEDGHVFRNL